MKLLVAISVWYRTIWIGHILICRCFKIQSIHITALTLEKDKRVSAVLIIFSWLTFRIIIYYIKRNYFSIDLLWLVSAAWILCLKLLAVG